MTLSNHKIPQVASKTACTACMACIDSCNHNALSYDIDKNGFFSIKVNTQQCIGCGACTKHCPVLNVTPNENKHYLECFSAWSNDDKLRERSASGGGFIAIAMEIIKQGGIVYGAVIDGLAVKHKRIEYADELHLLQGSKYQPSILAGIYKSVRSDLNAGRLVLFSGLGCQVAGLYSFLGKGKNYDNLFTIDTICGGVSTMLPIINLNRENKYTSIISFRDKEHGWQSRGFKYQLKMLATDGQIVNLSDQNMVIRAFCNKIGKRDSCLDCSFSGIHRMSDCTIGDFWGIEIDEKEERKGVSALLVHSERFSVFVRSCNITLNRVDWEKIATSNPCLYFNHFPIIRHFISRKLFLRALKKGKDKQATMILESFITKLETKIYNCIQLKRKQNTLSKLVK
ncbi:4Fe-4S dicluster domain-containing protein [Bacteroidales bacterium SW292]|nr:4Fe-4S dicluster domain-containing protein [Bacteroidales bacterium SW292]